MSNPIQNFEFILKKQCVKQSLGLYSDKKPQNKHTVKPQDVLSSVSMQLKAFQNADTLISVKSAKKDLHQYKKSLFLSENNLPVYDEAPKQSSKFDTQCVSDTQLINMIDDIEANDVHRGMTQEFETSFCHHTEKQKTKDDNNGKKDNAVVLEKTNTHRFNINEKYKLSTGINTLEDKNVDNFQEKVIKDETNAASVSSLVNNTENNNSVCSPIMCDNKIKNEEIDLKSKYNHKNENTQAEEFSSILNQVTEIEDELLDDDVAIERPISPIIMHKHFKIKSKTPSPLIFNLERFEQFEKFALPILEASDLKTAKHVINSQILAKELHIKMDEEILLNERDILSPILEIKKETDEDSKTELKTLKVKDPNLDMDLEFIQLDKATSDDLINKVMNKNFESLRFKTDSEVLKDDILFSSDEEEDSQKKYQDLPFTCALETSFYDQVDVLDKTMYVGFQTASNKSIQIFTESFAQAKSILSDDITVTDLVKNCDSSVKSTAQNAVVKKEQTNMGYYEDEKEFLAQKSNKEADSKVSTEDNDDIFNNDSGSKDVPAINSTVSEETNYLKAPVERNFGGFITANNKVIKLSEKTLARCKKVFQDIDLTEGFATQIDMEKVERNIEDKILQDEAVVNKEAVDDEIQNIDEVIIQEFENIEMCLKEDKRTDTKSAVIEILSPRIKKDLKIPKMVMSKINDIVKDDLDVNINETNFADTNLERDTLLNIPEVPELRNSKSEPIVGFKTASNKYINISKEALEKTKNVFQDIDSIELPAKASKSLEKIEKELIDSEQPSTCKASFIGFKTANNKNIKISEEALAKTRNIFKDIDSTDFKYNKDVQKNTNEDTEDYSNQCLINKTSCVGFVTASNKDIKISKEVLAKTKNIFEEIDSAEFKFTSKHYLDSNKTKSTEELKGFIQPLTSNATFVGFKTANNKEIKISDKALTQTKTIFKDIDSLDFKYPEKKRNDLENKNGNIVAKFELNQPSNITQNNVGFNTANMRDIKKFDKALSETKNIFENIDSDDFKCSFNPSKEKIEYKMSPQSNDELNALRQPPTTSGFAGFKTANNHTISISKDSLAKTKNIFKDIDSADFRYPEKASKQLEKHAFCEKRNSKVDELTNKSKTINMFQPSTSKTTFVGFQTANNKKINISKESLAKTKNIFKDIDSNDDIFPKKPNRYSKELEHAKITYSEGYNLEQPTNLGIKSNFVGFKTPNSKVINISETALAKSETIFKDIDAVDIQSIKKRKDDYPNIRDVDNWEEKEITENNVPSTNSPKFQGFRTASNKQVTVSEDAFIISRQILKDFCINDNYEGKDFPKKENQFDENLSGNIHYSNTDDIPVKGKSSPVFKGFQTANRNPVTVSKEALAKSKKLFQDIDLLSDDEPEFLGFKTPIDREVKENVLIEAKKLFEDGFESRFNFKGFQTASDKNVFVSEDSLAISRKMFQDIDANNLQSENKIEEKASLRYKIECNTAANRFAVDADTENADYYLKADETKSCNSKVAFKTGTNRDIKVSDDALARTKRFFSDIGKSKESQINNNNDDRNNEENISNIIDTQVLNNFEETLYTEDFHETSLKSKRSGSPILSCPRAKKRKRFEIPYSQKLAKPEIKTEIINKNVNKIIFNDNYKATKKYTLKDLTDMAKNYNNTIDPYLLQFTFDNLLQFEFHDNRNGLSNGNMTIDFLKELFLNSVNTKLVPNGWLDNHLKLILWKLISYEIKFKSAVVCSARIVMDQLKFRYDKELYNAQRPALRKILEKDDVPSKTLVLCVAQIYADGVNVVSATTLNNIELLLTDGWYCIKASIDKMLAQLVSDGKIGVGTKIVTNGAELVNCVQGVSPWEDTSAVRLKIFGNSTRRARWDARLGYHSNPAILSQLSSVKLDGGKVSKLRVFVTRVYPALYVEKFEDGSTVTRSERLEYLHQMKTETERQVIMEKLYEEVEREFSDQESQDSEGFSEASVKRSCLDSGSQIAKLMKRSKDPAEFRVGLTSSQLRLLEAHTSKRRERLLEDIQKRIREKIEKAGVCVNRNVVTLLKIRIAGVIEKNGVEITKGMMSIWKPNDAILEIIKEGAWIDVMNVVPTAMRFSEIQISAGRQSVFSTSKYKEPENFKPYTKLLKRSCFTVKELVQKPSMSTDYNEIDTVGIVFLIEPSIKDFDSTKQPFQNVYLADAEKNMICVNFWGGLVKFGFQNVLDTGQIVACANLQKRAGNTRKCIPQYRVTEFSYFTKSPKNENARNFVDDLNKIFLSLDRRKFCDDCVVLKNNYSVLKNVNENISPYRFNNSACNLSKHKMFLDSPLVRPNRKDDNFNLTGLDFESTFRQTDTQNLPEEVLRKKKKVNEKIAKLKMYGEPPPLSHIHIINKSKNATSSYKSPLLTNNNNNKISDFTKTSLHSKSYHSVNVTSVNETPEKCENLNESDVMCSPVLMNRTYIKKVNPVKINFDVKDNNDSNIDHFAEEFDGSPPLSLD